MELDITVALYRNMTRKFTVVMDKKEVSDVFRLEQIIGDLRGQIANLQGQIAGVGTRMNIQRGMISPRE